MIAAISRPMIAARARHPGRRRRLAAVVLGLLSLAACQTVDEVVSAADRTGWRVVERLGEVRYQAPGSMAWAQVTSGTWLPHGSEVGTGPGGRVIVANGEVQVRADPESAFILPWPARGERWNHGSGLLRYRAKRAPVAVDTPHLGIDGDDAVFDVLVSGIATEVTVDQGQVRIVTPDGLRRAELSAGQSAYAGGLDHDRLAVRLAPGGPLESVERIVLPAIDPAELPPSAPSTVPPDPTTAPAATVVDDMTPVAGLSGTPEDDVTPIVGPSGTPEPSIPGATTAMAASRRHVAADPTVAARSGAAMEDPRAQDESTMPVAVQPDAQIGRTAQTVPSPGGSWIQSNDPATAATAASSPAMAHASESHPTVELDHEVSGASALGAGVGASIQDPAGQELAPMLPALAPSDPAGATESVLRPASAPRATVGPNVSDSPSTGAVAPLAAVAPVEPVGALGTGAPDTRGATTANVAPVASVKTGPTQALLDADRAAIATNPRMSDHAHGAESEDSPSALGQGRSQATPGTPGMDQATAAASATPRLEGLGRASPSAPLGAPTTPADATAIYDRLSEGMLAGLPAAQP